MKTVKAYFTQYRGYRGQQQVGTVFFGQKTTVFFHALSHSFSALTK